MSAVTYPVFDLGQCVVFAEEAASWKVSAVSQSGRFMVLTRGDQHRPGKVRYTVMDLMFGIRGTATSYGLSFVSAEECTESMAAFERAASGLTTTGHGPLVSEISYRNWVWIQLADVQPDPRTGVLLSDVRHLVANAPVRVICQARPQPVMG